MIRTKPNQIWSESSRYSSVRGICGLSAKITNYSCAYTKNLWTALHHTKNVEVYFDKFQDYTIHQTKKYNFVITHLSTRHKCFIWVYVCVCVLETCRFWVHRTISRWIIYREKKRNRIKTRSFAEGSGGHHNHKYTHSRRITIATHSLSLSEEEENVDDDEKI